MILSFLDRESEKIFNRKYVSKISQPLQAIALRKLLMLDAAVMLQDLRVPPSNHLEKLKVRKDRYSIRINKQWRLCFEWRNHNAYLVQIIDYH